MTKTPEKEFVHLTNRTHKWLKEATGPRKLGEGRASGLARPLSRSRCDKSAERVSDIISVDVSKGSSGPVDAHLRGGPYTEERATFWRGKPPPFDPILDWRVYNDNKELAEDLCNGVCVKIGRLSAFSFREGFLK